MAQSQECEKLLVRSDISANREGVRHQCEKLLVQSDISANREGV